MNRIITDRSCFYKFLRCLFFAAIIFLFCPINAKAQIRDAVAVDTISADTVAARKHTTRQAVIYSLICPGLGQIYNKKYWKIPFIYGAGGTFLYYINYNQVKYKKFRTALFEQDRAKTKDAVVIDGFVYPYVTLEQGRDYYRRYRDLSVAGFAAIYLLNVIDAMVDAQFFNYDISDDLSMKVEPAVMQNTGLVGTTASVGLRIHIGF